MTAPRRRWFRFAFSLRTLFVLVTACALWLGWQVSIVQERNAVIAECRRVSKDQFDRWYVNLAAVVAPEQFDYVRISLVRKLLGDEACICMDLPPLMGREWTGRAEVAFPEAELWVMEADRTVAYRDSLYAPFRWPNRGTLFKTGIRDPNAADNQADRP